MNHIAEFDNLTKNTRRREFDDGLMDYVFGSTFLFLGILGWFFFSSIGLRWLSLGLLHNREITVIALISIIPLLIILIYGARRIIELIRRQTLWKNRGFVKSLNWQVSWQTNALAAFVFVAIVLIAVWLLSNGVVNQEFVLRTMVSSIGIATGVVFYGMGKDLYLDRYKWVGIIGATLSILIALLPITFSISWLLLGAIWMIILAVSGSWALRKSILAYREGYSD